MICLTCAELKPVRRGAACPTCAGPLLDETAEALEQLVAAKLKAQVARWAKDGQLDRATAERLSAGLPEVRLPEEAKRPVSKRADAVAEQLPAADEARPGWLDSLEQAFAERDDWKRKPAEEDATSDAAAGAGGALFGTRSTGALTGGLHTLAELDEGDASLGSVVGQYVWWFIGTLLVLGGSVMGVREAWLALGGVPRLLVVAGALLAYHGGFVALSSVVAKKSGVAGRVLGGIALSLLPVVFAALSALVALSLPFGAAASLGAVAVAAFTLRVLGRRFEGDPVALGLAFLPALLAELPLSLATLDPDARVLLPLAGVAACGVAARRGFAALLLALYGLLALGVFTVVGAPGLAAVALDFGSFGFVALTGWAAATAIAVVPALTTPQARTAFPHAAPAAEVVGLAVAAISGVAAFAGALAVEVGVDRRADTFSALVPIIAAGSFAVVRSERRHAVHPAILLTVLASVLLARLEWQGTAAGWMLGPAGVAAMLFVTARFTERKADGVLLALWGAAIGLGAVIAARLIDAPPLKAALIAAALVAVSAHGAGAWKFFMLHYVGGLAALIGLEAWVVTPNAFPLVLAAAGAAYLVLGRAWRLHPAADATCWPLDDVSVAASVGSGLLLCLGALAGPAPSLLLYETAGGIALVLGARVFIDKSRAMSFAAATVLGAGLFVATRAQAGAGAAALALAALAVVRGAGNPDQRGRKLLGLFPLPFGAAGRVLWGDGFAGAALLFTALSTLRAVAFLSAISEPDRPAVVLGAACVLGVALVAFFTRGFGSFAARGHIATWCAAGLAVVVAALANRLGRPLPPQVVGLRFSFIVPALWGFAIAMRRFGPALGRWLENEPHGKLYHWVPHAGVGALGALCVVEGLVVGGADPTAFLVTAPPLLFVGGALAALLLGRSFRLPALTSTGLGILVFAAACAGAQRALLGPELAQTAGRGAWLLVTAPPPGGFVWERAALGVAVLAFGYAVLAALSAFPSPRAALARLALGSEVLLDLPLTPKLLADWAERAAFAVFAAALFQPRLAAAGLVAGAGLMLRFAGERKAAGRVALFGLGALHAALAVAGGVVPFWAGPALGAVAIAVIATRVLRGADEDQLLRAHGAATALGVAALVWALATGGAVDASFALPSVAAASGWGLWATWPSSWAVPLTLAGIAAVQLIAGARWTGALRRWTLAGAVVDVGLSLAAGTAVWLEAAVNATRAGRFVWPRLVTAEGGPLSLALCGAVIAAHLATLAREEREERDGFALGRDLTGALLGVLLAIFVGAADRSQLALATGAAALAGVFIVSVLAALRTKTGRHAWAAQVSVVGGYALVQAQWVDAEPALDAVFGLGFAFVLVGVTVLARRAKVAPVAKATRAFAALLPVVLVFVFPSSATRDTALLAAASSLLYAVLATVEHNRFFGALAAVSANLALLVLALSQGLNGAEIFLAPLGLLLLILAQLFKKTLLPGTRNAVRVIGGLLLYAPAAVKLSFQLGDAADATYAVVFGGVCLLGVAAGMLLQIRAYLAMGTLFLTLDVVANLVNAGLRDYRVGFVVLSATGLLVLAAMVFATLKKELVQGWMRAFRARIRGWD